MSFHNLIGKKMKFKALPVNVGDCFLIECNKKMILVDGGQNKTHIIKLLKNENIPNNHFDVLICTHYDSDHVNGIIGILKSQNYTFKEIWLPEILGSIGYSIESNVENIFKNLHNYENNSYTLKENVELPFKELTNENQIEEIDFNLLSVLKRELKNDYLYFRYLNNNYNTKIIKSLISAIKLISQSNNSGAYIRWFKYQSSYSKDLINFNLSALNCKQSGLNKFNEVQFFYALQLLSTINQESLVFMYEDETYPNILFTADSDLSFCSSIHLRENSLVTAPHHGSSANDSAYSKLKGDNLIFVRSDRSQIKRPGKGFLMQSHRYCTICRNKTIKNKVELQYNNNRFVTQNSKCIC